MSTPDLCTGPCQRPLASNNQPAFDDVFDLAPDTAVPHHKHRTVCISCIDAGYTPPVALAPTKATATTSPSEPLPTPTRLCTGCDYDLTPTPIKTLVEAALAADDNSPLEDAAHPGVCSRCIERGYVPPPADSRRDVVIENCNFYAQNGIGLVEAAQREGYSDKTNLDSVLRRWGALDLTRLLTRIDERGERNP